VDAKSKNLGSATHRDKKGFDLIIPQGMALSGRVVIREIEPERSEPRQQTPRQTGPGGRR
jgi:hypothetical protein